MIPTATDDDSSTFSSTESEWSQPLWLHPTAPANRSAGPSTPSVLPGFARMAAPIGLAAWMFGTALVSSCAPADLAGAAPSAGRLVESSLAAGMEVGLRVAAVPLCAAPVQAAAVRAAPVETLRTR